MRKLIKELDKGTIKQKSMSNKIFVDFTKLDYKCPHCNTEHYDKKDELCEKLNKSKDGWIKKKCSSCRKFFGYTVDMTSQSVGFLLN